MLLCVAISWQIGYGRGARVGGVKVRCSVGNGVVVDADTRLIVVAGRLHHLSLVG
ncbi:hypothetical protein GCM10010424_25260 [Streptomyces lienomycini]